MTQMFNSELKIKMQKNIKILLLISALLIVQTTTFASPQPTPVNVHIQRSPMDKLNIRLREHNIQIERETRLGKLTKAQAKSLKAQVETIRKSEIANLKTREHEQRGQASIL